MKRIVSQVLAGCFEETRSVLEINPSRLELTIEAGGEASGSFTISCGGDFDAEGFVACGNLRMSLQEDSFVGDTEIHYCFNGSGLVEGDVVKGQIQIISSKGEYTLPYSVMVSHSHMESSLGAIKNLFHFANLAKSNWQEAVSLFYAPEFYRLFLEGDSQYLGLYQGLSRYYLNERNVEEFLIAVNKKQKVTYALSDVKVRIDGREKGGRHALTITKSGWGYTRLAVSVTDRFIRLEKNYLSEDDFLGDTATLYYYVEDEKLHKGLNHCAIIISNSFTSMRVDVQIRGVSAKPLVHSRVLEKQNLWLQMMELYCAFRMKLISGKSWLTGNGELLSQYRDMDDNDPVPRLFQAHLLLTQERVNEASWELEQAKNLILTGEKEDSTTWCYYLYLTTLRGQDEEYINRICDEVKLAYRKEPNNWKIGWLLLYLSPEYTESPSKKWIFLKRQFERGCYSPVFYTEALLLMRQEPSLFMELGAFEQQVLLYAAKHDGLNAEMIMQLHYLVSRVKEYSAPILRILQKAYELQEDEETLTDICMMLIAGGKQGPAYLKWYRLGVEHNLRITRLYEYFMYSIDLDEVMDLPKVIYMYFSFENTLPYQYTAYLYCALLRQKEQYSDLYAQAMQNIQEFVLKMIAQQKINKDLAVLYREILSPVMIDGQVAESLGRLLFICKVQVYLENITQVVVRQPGEAVERRYPVSGGIAYIPVYGEDFFLMLEDKTGGRYTGENTYRFTRMMKPGRLLMEIAPFAFSNAPLELYLCNRESGNHRIREENVQHFEHLLASEDILASVKQPLYVQLAQYYYDQDEMEKLDSFLLTLYPECLESVQRGEIMRFLLLRDKLEVAAKWIENFGIEGLDSKTLNRLSSRMITGNVETKIVLKLCYESFQKGKCDTVTLTYLMEHFVGLTKNLRDIWKAAVDKLMPLHEFSERLLVQMMFTGHYVGEKMEIFRTYLENEPAMEPVKAFLTQCAYDYFVQEQLTDELIFKHLTNLFVKGEEMHRVCKLAYAQYYGENRKLIAEKEKYVLAGILQEMLLAQDHLPVCMHLQDMFPFMSYYADKVILLHRAMSGKKVMIHYVISGEGEKNEDYHTMEMHQIMDRVYSCPFILFFGEKLLYYITEENEWGEELTQSGELSNNDAGRNGDLDRFYLLNDIMISQNLQDGEGLRSFLEEYIRTDYKQEKIFYLE